MRKTQKSWVTYPKSHNNGGVRRWFLCLWLNHQPETHSVWSPQQNQEQWLDVKGRHVWKQHEREFLNWRHSTKNIEWVFWVVMSYTLLERWKQRVQEALKRTICKEHYKSSTWELVRSTDSCTPLQACWIRNCGWAQPSVFQQSPGDSDPCSSLRITGIEVSASCQITSLGPSISEVPQFYRGKI